MTVGCSFYKSLTGMWSEGLRTNTYTSEKVANGVITSAEISAIRAGTADPRDGKSETEAAAMKVVDLEGNTFDVSHDLSETVRGNRGEAAMTIPL